MNLTSWKAQAAQLSEAAIQEAVMGRLQARKWLVIRINGGQFKSDTGSWVRTYIVQGIKASTGVPDILALKGRNFLLLECKDAKGEPNEAQIRFAKFAAQFGIIVYIVRSVDDVDPILKELKEELCSQ